MNDNRNRVFYFMFGYHCPDGWKADRRDPDFDYTTTGILPVRAPDEIAASRWGTCIAKWYLSLLFDEHPEMAYSWSPKNYAIWVELDVPEGCEDVVRQLPAIELDSYPEFSIVKTAFHD